MRLTKDTPTDVRESVEEERRLRRNELAKSRYAKDPERFRQMARARAERARVAQELSNIEGCLRDRHFSKDDRMLVNNLTKHRTEFSGMARTRAEWVLGNFRSYTPMRGWQEEASAALATLS